MLIGLGLVILILFGIVTGLVVFLNPLSLDVIRETKVEPSLARARPGSSYQFERIGYFCLDPDSAPGKLVFNRTVPLRDTWAKIQQKTGRL